jgi:NADPH:quinone reductase-like Zn-dependent oxidoreductase
MDCTLIPDPKALPETKDEWVVVLGGASSVGKYAIQVILFSLHPREPNLM